MTGYLIYQYMYNKYKKSQSWDFLKDYSFKKLDKFTKAFAQYNPKICEQNIEQILSYFPVSDKSTNINYENIVRIYYIGLTDYSLKLLRERFPEMTIEDHILLSYLGNFYSFGQNKKIINHMQRFQSQLINYFQGSFVPDSLHKINIQLSKDIAYTLGQQIFFIFYNKEEDISCFNSSALPLSDETKIRFSNYDTTNKNKILSDAVLFFIKHEFCEFLFTHGLSSYDKFFYTSTFIKPYESIILLKKHFPECSITFNTLDKNKLENMLIKHILFVSTNNSFGFISNKFPEILKLISIKNQVFWERLHSILLKNTNSIEEYADLATIITEQNILQTRLSVEKTNSQRKTTRI